MAEREDGEPGRAGDVGGGYAWYVLAVLVLVYVFNFIDRQILSILAQEIKGDLGLSDAEIGFLYGTAFAVFYAIFGIPLGRLADVWVRRSLIAIGLAFWSAMTALSGTARSFASLGAYRIGVGVGEASASPAAFSSLVDWFPARLRATAISIYSSGVYIGAGIGIFLGGWIVDAWRAAYPDGGAPLALKGWHVAYIAVGLPGILLAIWVATLREPRRGQSEGLREPPRHPRPFAEFGRELMAVLPPLTLLSLASAGAGGAGIARNLAGALAIAVAATLLIVATGNVAQWVALGIGVYAAFSWAQGLRLRDAPTHALIFGTPALLCAAFGFACIAFVTYGIGFWLPPFFIRHYGASASEVGTYIGLASAVGGWIGVTLGGVASDALRMRTPRARLWLGGATIAFSVPVAVGVLYAPNAGAAYALNFLFSIVSPLWVGPAATTMNELVLPRMRALVSAFYLLVVTFVGLALGPYTMGQLSDRFAAAGHEPGEALRLAMLVGLAPLAVSGLLIALAWPRVASAESTKLDRARLAGEPAT
jgi:MFS family permease